MKNKILSILLCMALLFSTIFVQMSVVAENESYDVWDGVSASSSLSGSGTYADPYLIQSAADLIFISNTAAANNTFSGKYVLLKTNIDLADHPFGAIHTFSGVFDGNGYEIKGININLAKDNVGFFRILNGTVRNLTLTGKVNGTGHNSIGGFAGLVNNAGATIFNCVNNVSVSENLRVGGFVGQAQYGTLNFFNCVNNGDVTSAYAGECQIGGFVGYATANATVNINYSKNNGVVSNLAGDSATTLAGFVGRTQGSVKIDHSINVGDITGGAIMAGFISRNDGSTNKSITIENSYNLGKITVKRTSGNAFAAAIFGYYTGIGTTTTKTFNRVYYRASDVDFGVATNNQSSATPFGTAKTEEEFTNGTVLNELGFLYVEGETYPELRQYSSGIGTAADPYVIATKEELIMLSQMVTVEQMSDYLDMSFALGNDIDLENDTRFVGIGNGYKSFKGDFDGKGYTVSGLNIGDGSGAYSAHPSGIGFFGVIGGSNERKIENLNVVGSVVSTAAGTTTTYVGGLVGRNTVKLTISDCSFNGTVYSAYTSNANTPAASGIICSAEAALDISGCSVFGKIDGYGRGGSILGSLNGNFAVNITNCYSVAEVTGKGANVTTTSPTAGGLIGFIGNGTVRLNNSFFAGTAPAERSSGYGGPVINHAAGGTLEAANVYYLADAASEFTTYNVGENKTADEFKNGTVVALLNANGNVFEQGSEHPKFVGQVIEGDTGNIPDDEEEEDDGRTYDVWDGTASASISGTGTDVDPFIIGSAADLKYFADSVNAGNDYSGKHIKLVVNIDLNKISFDPIGSRNKWFRGIFNGNGNVIKNLNITSESTNGIGFFGACNNAKIKNLTVKGTVKGTVCTTATPVAGLVGIVSAGSMEDCAFIGTVYSSNASSTFSNYPAASGLVCSVEGAYSITRCYVSGKIDGCGRSGGLVGMVNGSFNLIVTDSYCDATVTGIGANTTTTSPTAGGLIGFLNTGTITLENCYFVGTAPNARASGYAGPIINHKAGGTLNCINTYYDSDKNPVEEAAGQKFGVAKTSAEFKDGTVLALLNDGILNPVFEQGENYPVLLPPVPDDGTIRDRVVRKYTFDKHPTDIATYNSNPAKYQNDGYNIDTIDGAQQLGARLYNYGRYNNNANLAPSAQYANGNGYGTLYTASLGGVFAFVDVSEIKTNGFYTFSVDAKVLDVEPEVTVQIGLFRATGAGNYGTLAFQDSEGNTYDTAIKTVKLTLDKKTDYKTYSVQISGAEILAFLSNYSDNANVIYFGVYCPTYINKAAYKEKVAMALDNFVATETAIPDGYVPADSLPVVDILNDDYTKSYGEHLYNIIENSSFEKDLTGVWSNLPKGFSVKTATPSSAMFGQKYLSATANNGTVKIAIPFKLTINKFYTFGISTRTTANAEYRVYVTGSVDGAPLYDVDNAQQKFVVNKNSNKNEIIRSGIYFRNTMKTTAEQYLVIEVSRGTVDFDEITLTIKSTTEKNRNHYEMVGSTTVPVYDAKENVVTEYIVPMGKTIYEFIESIVKEKK